MTPPLLRLAVLLGTPVLLAGCSFFKQSHKTETHQYQTSDGGYTAGGSVTWPAPVSNVSEADLKKAQAAAKQ